MHDGLELLVSKYAINKAKDYTDQVAQGLAGGVKYKGSVATVADLPATAQMGDMYTVTENGHEYLRDQSTWVDLGADLSNYLPLSGGTMSGSITTSANDVIRKTTTVSYLNISGGVNSGSGANLTLCGKDKATQPGEFWLSATDGTNTPTLKGKPDKTFTWNSVDHTAWSMPRSSYETLSLPASCGSVIAPDDGWFCLVGTPPAFTAQNVDFGFFGVGTLMSMSCPGGSTLFASAPVVKGSTVMVVYSGNFSTGPELRFYKAEGEED